MVESIDAAGNAVAAEAGEDDAAADDGVIASGAAVNDAVAGYGSAADGSAVAAPDDRVAGAIGDDRRLDGNIFQSDIVVVLVGRDLNAGHAGERAFGNAVERDADGAGTVGDGDRVGRG